MGEVISFPFGGQIFYQVETNYGDGFQASSTTYRISDSIQNVRLDTGEVNTVLRDISSPSIADFSRTKIDPTLHVEWVLQPNDVKSFEKLCTDRTNCDLSSLAFEIGINTCSNASDAYYNLKGCKCKTFNISAAQFGNYICTADFSVASIVTSSSPVAVDPGALGTEYAAFNIAGGVTWNGVTGAYVTNSLNITVENNIQDLYDVGNMTKKAAIPGAVDISGSCDLSLDNGGKTHWDEVIGGTDITSVVFNTGLDTGENGKITLYNGRFDSTSVDINTSGEGMMASVPFKFKDIKFSKGG